MTADPGLLNRLAWNLRWSDRARSVSLSKAALRLLTVQRDSCIETAQARRTLAWQAKWRGDFDDAVKNVSICERLASESDAPDVLGQCYAIEGVVHYSRHRLDLARDVTERGLGLSDISDNTRVDLLVTMATIQRYSGHGGKSGLTLMRAREISKAADLARVEHNLARWMLLEGDAAGALRHARLSVKLSEEHKNRVILPYALEIAGSAAAAVGYSREAVGHFSRGVELALKDEDLRVLCQLLEANASFEMSRGHADRALDLLNHGAGIARGLSYPLWQQRFALSMARAHEEKGDLAAALAHHKEAWRYQKLQHDRPSGAGSAAD